MKSILHFMNEFASQWQQFASMHSERCHGKHASLTMILWNNNYYFLAWRIVLLMKLFCLVFFLHFSHNIFFWKWAHVKLFWLCLVTKLVINFVTSHNQKVIILIILLLFSIVKWWMVVNCMIMKHPLIAGLALSFCCLKMVVERCSNIKSEIVWAVI